MIKEFFTQNLYQLMASTGIDGQLDLSRRTGIPQSTISNWFQGNNIASAEKLETLSTFFNVEPYYFFMKPGTQGDIKPVERDDDFKVFLDGLAEKYLDEHNRQLYHLDGGHRTWIKLVKNNYETFDIRSCDWFDELCAIVTKYTSLDIIEKLRSKRLGQEEKKALAEKDLTPAKKSGTAQ